MKNRWSNRDERAYVRRYGGSRTEKREIARMVYAARLLGADPALVLHGGGNASVKTGAKSPVLWVKGSGRDMAALDPAGLTPLELSPIRALARRKALSDHAMIKAGRARKTDPEAPDPSVEYLLHAFLDDAVVLHTHANAVLALTNQRDGEKRAREEFGARVAVIPYAQSGFALAAAARAARTANPGLQAIVVARHGVFTFAADARTAYGHMIRLVGRAERALARAARSRKRAVFAAAPMPRRLAPLADVAPVIRGALADPAGQVGRANDCTWILEFRTSPALRRFASGRDVRRYAAAGPATPDHVIWTKPKPLILPAPASGEMENFGAVACRAAQSFRADYAAYAAKHGGRGAEATPRIVVVPGLGIFGVGVDPRAAKIAADLFEATADIVEKAESLGRYRPATARQIADIEFWAPERAKIKPPPPLPFAGRIVAVTGGGSGIGAATAQAFAEGGAVVAVLDLDGAAAVRVAGEISGLAYGCDVTDAKDVRRTFDEICCACGGLDIVVSNAGAAWSGEIGTVSDDVLRRSFELNFFAHQTAAQNAVRVMRAQGTGGCLLFNASKQALDPGPKFGPYGAPKAATLALMRHYAIDHGADGIRANAVNADRIRTGLLTDAMIATRSRARRLSREQYMAGNLLGAEVTAADVAQAFVSLALARKTTGAILTVDGGNMAAAVR